MKTKDKIIKLPSDIDAECVDICNVLNSLPETETFESCCGHLKGRFNVWFFCNSIDTLSRLGRAVERNYSDGKWEIVIDSIDTHPKGVFWLRTKEPFKTQEEMSESVNSLIENIKHWFKDEFDEYFSESPTDESYNMHGYFEDESSADMKVVNALSKEVSEKIISQVEACLGKKNNNKNSIMIMDYEKKYNKAFGFAKQAYGTGAYDDLTLETIFPELKESKDEKIRKAIESIIRVYGKTQGEWIAGYDMDTLVVHLRDAFACLEKQKEQEPAEWSENDKFVFESACNALEIHGHHKLSKMLKALQPRLKQKQQDKLPTWRIWKNGACGNANDIPLALVESCGSYKLVSCLGIDGQKYIMLSELKKLPGFNEKSDLE